jgi:hypothetical protein
MLLAENSNQDCSGYGEIPNVKFRLDWFDTIVDQVCIREHMSSLASVVAGLKYIFLLSNRMARDCRSVSVSDATGRLGKCNYR